MNSTDPFLLDVSSVSVEYPIRRRSVLGFRSPMFAAVKNANLTVSRGETVAIVGESGSGKSTLARAIMGLQEPSTGSIKLAGAERVRASTRALKGMRRRMQMVFQDPYSSLNPSMTVLDLVGEPLRVHTHMTLRQRAERVAEVLAKVGLNASHMNRYSYEFSGGQRQRIAIARAIVLSPELIVLDEPVSALDIPTQNQIVQLLQKLQDDLGTAYLIIAHDLSLLRHIADRVAVMYLGRIVEFGDTELVYEDPRHPYTRALLSAAPVPDPRIQRARRNSPRLTGELPDPANPPPGCVFSTRCPYVMPKCREVEPPLVPRGSGRLSACLLDSDSLPPWRTEALRDSEERTGRQELPSRIAADVQGRRA